MKVIITGWKPITIKNVAMNYNGGGDPKYAIKLQFVYTLLTKTEYYENAKNNNYSTADILMYKRSGI